MCTCVFICQETVKERGSELNGLYLTEAKVKANIKEDYPDESDEFYEEKWLTFKSDREKEALCQISCAHLQKFGGIPHVK